MICNSTWGQMPSLAGKLSTTAWENICTLALLPADQTLDISDLR